jgi:DNA-binding HxlR family transcriptional regulator
VLGNSYEGQVCSAARSLEVVGERWSLLIVRDALFGGVTRFSEFSSEGSAYQEYRLTDKGRDLAPVIIALTDWGDRWAAPNGRPIIYRHVDCGGDVEQQLVCSECRTVIDQDQVGVELGPGMSGAA